MKDYDPRNWYWFVGGDQTQAFSSASGAFVPAADATFQAWLAGGNVPTKIDTAANLGGVLAQPRIRPNDASVLAGYQTALLPLIDVAALRVIFNHENRIRVLEGKAAITQPQFIAALAALL